MQVLEITIRTTFQQLGSHDQQFIYDSIHKIMDSISSDSPSALKNKICLLSVLLFKFHTPAQVSYFDLRIMTATQSINTEHESRLIDLFLRLCLIFDEEIVDRSINRTQIEVDLNTNLKDVMRISAIPKLVQMWLFIINHFTLKSSNPEMINNSLIALAKYTCWIDISLVSQPDFLYKLCSLVQDDNHRLAALECLNAILGKGMQAYDKLTLISSMNIIPLIM